MTWLDFIEKEVDGPKTRVEHDLLYKAERKKIETLQFQKPVAVFYPLWSFPLVYFSLSRQCERAGGKVAVKLGRCGAERERAPRLCVQAWQFCAFVCVERDVVES